MVARNRFVNCRQVFFDVMDDGEKTGERDYLILELPGGGESVLMVVRVHGQIALVANGRACDDMRPHLVLPGGLKNLGGGENLGDAALRELKEELGIVAESATLVKLGVVDVHPLVRDRVHVYLIECFTEAGTPLDAETLAVKWCWEQDVDQLVQSGDLTDGQTLAALHLLERHDRRPQMSVDWYATDIMH